MFPANAQPQQMQPLPPPQQQQQQPQQQFTQFQSWTPTAQFAPQLVSHYPAQAMIALPYGGAQSLLALPQMQPFQQQQPPQLPQAQQQFMFVQPPLLYQPPMQQPPPAMLSDAPPMQLVDCQMQLTSGDGSEPQTTPFLNHSLSSGAADTQPPSQLQSGDGGGNAQTSAQIVTTASPTDEEASVFVGAVEPKKWADDDNFTQVIVNYLPLTVNDRMLHSLFERFGTIVRARVMFDRVTGQSKGYGFVYFRTHEEAENARRSMNGSECQGRWIKVSPAHQRAK